MPEKVPRNWRAVVNRFYACPEEIQSYFESVPELIENYDWEVVLGFMFIRLEKALNNMLYCGVRKVHRANSDVAYRFVDRHHMTRKEFRRLFKNVIGKSIPIELTDILSEAEKVRNKIIHGKSASDADQRKAIVRLLAYAEEMNELVYSLAGFKPFTGSLQGFAGRGDVLNKSTSTWLMKGLGFTQNVISDSEGS